jgi:hypothetical protein
MGIWLKKEMAELIEAEQAEVAEDLPRHGLSAKEQQRITDAHKLALSEIADEDGHKDLAEQLRREIDD